MLDVIPGYTALSVVSDTGEFLIYRVIVNELHKALIPSRALFAGGKFDQYKRDVPGVASGVEIHYREPEVVAEPETSSNSSEVASDALHSVLES